MLLVCSGCLHLGAGNSHFCDLAMKVLRASIVLLRRMEWDAFSRCSPDFSKDGGKFDRHSYFLRIPWWAVHSRF